VVNIIELNIFNKVALQNLMTWAESSVIQHECSQRWCLWFSNPFWVPYTLNLENRVEA